MALSNEPMVSETSICNQALTWLGQGPVLTLDEPAKTAQWMKANYRFIRDAVVEERMWTFSLARGVSTTQNKDGWGQNFAHLTTTDWLSIYRVYKDPQDAAQIEWKMEDGHLICDYETVYIWGQKRVTDTGKFSSLFVQALAGRLAADACVPLTENRLLQKDLWALYGQKIAIASTRDGQQGSNETIQSSSMVDARAYGRYS